MKRLHELSPSLEATELLAALTRLGPNYLELGLSAMREASWRRLGRADALQLAVSAMVRQIQEDMSERIVLVPVPVTPQAKWKTIYDDGEQLCTECGEPMVEGDAPPGWKALWRCTNGRCPVDWVRTRTPPPGPCVAEPMEDSS